MAVLPRAPSLPSNAQLSALLDEVDEALLLFDARQRLSFCNRAAGRWLGCESGQGAALALGRLQGSVRDEVLQALAGDAVQRHWPAVACGTALLRLSLAPATGAGRVLRLRPERGSEAPPPRLQAQAMREIVHLLWDSPLPLLVQDQALRIVAANRALLELLGRPPTQVLGRDAVEMLPPEDHGAFVHEQQGLLAAMREGCQPEGLRERRIVDRAGVERWFRCAPRWASAEDGAPLLLSILLDVTAEHRTQARAELAGDELEQWFDLSPIGMLVYDPGGLVVRSNAAFAALVGPAPVALQDAAADLRQLLAWEGQGPHPSLRADAPPFEVRAQVLCAGGRRQRLRARLRALHNVQGQLRVMAVVEDHSLEDEHDLAQLEIGALMDTAGVGVATYEASRGWLQSRTARAVAPGDGSGAAAQGALQSIGRDQVEAESLPEFERLQKALREGRRVQVRYAVRLPDTGLRWLLTRVEPGVLTGGRSALSVATLDITEQEEAHRRSEQLLRELSTILDGTSAGIAYLRGERLVRCNGRFEAMLGLAPGQAAGAAIEVLFAAHPQARDLLRQALASAGRCEVELSRREADGRVAWYALSASGSTAAGEPEVVAVLTDVSRLKSQQAELEALGRDRALMFSLSDVGIAYLRGGRIERANEAMASLTGYEVDELEQLPLERLFDGDGVDAAPAASGHWRGEQQLCRRDGRRVWVQASRRCVDEAAPEAGLICSYVDIDERHAAREAMQRQAERTRAILDSVLVGIVTVGDQGIEWMNRSARRMFGGEIADFIGAPIGIVATDEPGHPLRAGQGGRLPAEDRSETFECRLRARDGREFWVVGNAVVTGGEGAGEGTRGDGGRQVTYALLDIERRRQAEVSIAQAQASLQRIIETAPLAIALFDAASGRVLRLNQMAALFFGRPIDEVLGHGPEQWFDGPAAAALRQDMAQACAQPDVLRRELQRPPSGPGGGEMRVWDMRIVSLDAAGEPQLLLVASDVTEQRAAEQARFEAAVSQREMLVKEVHHRIKNNLQGVAGLLQQTAARRPEVAVLINEAVGQVQAIAQVHGLQVGVSGPLRIKPLLESITASVQRTFGRPIRLVVDGAPAHRYALPEAESIPIALTINELLTNAIKHCGAGDVGCSLHCDDAGLTLTVVNPGRLREGFSLAQVPPGVSGLGLVRALLPRRSATLTLEQVGDEVQARVVLVPPSVTLLEPL
jgi:PAS domain S-box-containing protein